MKKTRYNKGFNSHGDCIDDFAYVDSLDYIVDTLINGNITYAKEQIAALSASETLELLEIAKEKGYYDLVSKNIKETGK